MSISIAELADKIGGELKGNGSQSVSSVATLVSANPDQLSFLSNSKYAGELANTRAAAVILSKDDALKYSGNAIIHTNPYVGFAVAAQLLDTSPQVAQGIDKNASIHPSATVGESTRMEAGAVICANATIGNNCTIGANVYIGQGATLGDNVTIRANACIHHLVTLEKEVVVHSGAVIGGDGFGYANDKGTWIKIPQTGSVVIGEGTEVGNNACIDRGALDDTVIGKNCIIDNLVQIGHNCIVGDHSCICGSTGIAGSVTIGKYVVIAGHVGINGHIRIADGVQITGYTMVTKSITEPGVYSSGMPAMPTRDWQRNTVKLRNIDKLYERVKQLEKEKSIK